MYTNSLSVITLGEGETPPSVNVELWRVWTTVSSDGIGTEHQSLLGSSTVTSGFGVPFSIGPAALQPVAASSSDFIALTVQTPGEPGFMFRSPRVSSLPNPGGPADAVDMWLTGEIILSPADIAGGLPALPMTVDAATTITAITVSLTDGGLDIVARGTVTIGLDTPLTDPTTNPFTYKLSVAIEPALLHEPGVALVARATSDGSITFDGSGLGNSIMSVLLNLLSPFIAGEVLPQVMARINASVTTAVVTRAVAALGGAGATLPPGGALPAGVGISVERVTATPAQLVLWASIHTFGNLRNLFFPTATTPRLNCVVTALAPLVPGLMLPGLYRFRDDVLARSARGRALVDIYYRHAPSLAQRCASDAAFRSAAVRLLCEFASVLRTGSSDGKRLERLARLHYTAQRETLPEGLRDDIDDWLCARARS